MFAFLSNSCWDVTLPLTTKACAGFAFCPAISLDIWLVPVPCTRLKLGAVRPPPPPPTFPLGFWLLPSDLVESILPIWTALKAPAKPACINGYAGNTDVIGLADAVVKAFCTPWNPDIVACATAATFAKSLPSFANAPSNPNVLEAIFNKWNSYC